MVDENKTYTVNEAAAALKISTQTIRKYLNNGELKGKKVGPRKKWIVYGDSLKKKLKDWNMLN